YRDRRWRAQPPCGWDAGVWRHDRGRLGWDFRDSDALRHVPVAARARRPPCSRRESPRRHRLTWCLAAPLAATLNQPIVLRGAAGRLVLRHRNDWTRVYDRCRKYRE